MGGVFSTRWATHSKRRTVETCLTLDIRALVRVGLVRSHHHCCGLCSWHLEGTPAQTWAVNIEANMLDLATPWVRLSYAINGQDLALDYKVYLTSTEPYFGGTRWWGLCPLLHHGRPCLRRVAQLYLPQGATSFGCRTCHELAYSSSRSHAPLFGRLAKNLS